MLRQSQVCSRHAPVFVLSWLFIGSVSSAYENLSFRVLSYNIHHCEGIDRKLDVDRIASVIRKSKADIVALQEVDQGARRSEGVQQATELARILGMNVAFGKNIDLQGGFYGNAMLSRFPIEETRNQWLPCLDNGEQRGVLVCKVSLPRVPSNLAFLATHFDHRRNEAERIKSAEAVNNLAESIKGPAILAGDFNAMRESRTIDLLEKQWTHTSAEELRTVPVAEPSRQIDFIFVRPKDAFRVVETKVLEEAVASDHRAILAVLELQLAD